VPGLPRHPELPHGDHHERLERQQDEAERRVSRERDEDRPGAEQERDPVDRVHDPTAVRDQVLEQVMQVLAVGA
jgi:hypothetical protein